MQENSDRNEDVQDALRSGWISSDMMGFDKPITSELVPQGDPPSEVIAEWWQVLDAPPPYDLLHQLICLAAERQREHGECHSHYGEWMESAIREAIFKDGEHVVAMWMSRGGYDIRQTGLTDFFEEWSFGAIMQAIELAAAPSSLFQDVLEVAFAAIPQPLRDSLETLTHVEGFDSFDAVVEALERTRLSANDDAGQIPSEILESFDRFVSNIRACFDAARSLSDAVRAARNEIGLP